MFINLKKSNSDSFIFVQSIVFDVHSTDSFMVLIIHIRNSYKEFVGIKESLIL